MKLREQIRKERKEFFANATPKEKFNYIKEYYGLYIMSAIVVIGFAIYITVQALTDPEPILNGLFINSYNHENSMVVTELGDDYMKDRDINTSEYEVSFGSGLTIIEDDPMASYESNQAIVVQISAGSVDFIVGPRDGMSTYAYDELFVDLSTVLSDEQIEKFKPYFLYIDNAVVRKKQEIDSLEEATDIPIPDPSKPEEMEEPIPVYIDLSQSKRLENVYGNAIDKMVYGIAFNAPYTENAIDFLEYVMEQPE